MKMEQKYILGIVALSFVAILGIGMVSAFGFGNGFMNQDMTEEEKAEMQEQHETMQNAIANGDYETWAELKRSQITEERFNEIQTRHQERAEFRTAMQEARESGDFSKIKELQEEYGFEGKGFGKGNRMHMQKMNSEECPFAK
jgi:peptidoglycan hydrolase-like amidase